VISNLQKCKKLNIRTIKVGKFLVILNAAAAAYTTGDNAKKLPPLTPLTL